MTGIEPAFYAGVVALVFILGTGWGVYKAFRGEVKIAVEPVVAELTSTKDRVKKAEADLIEFRLEVSRTYTTKEDVYNANKPVLESVERLTGSVDRMGVRIDRVIEQSNAVKPASRRRTAD